ncbi:GAF and ANTAR domain-containing protein [Streptomyces justiciae]|uniref:GAF and ANTAR domain-containing protein n=1 Tax=Streptomyces justiciae TaxID=2780140 RepID=UPI001881D1EB|nr:GAF and ANTAR domain-containing protein [Streptomyces justiciae]MBE8475848.1 ANTAR domain-containing protein [Streptomyces justiciae]MCW8382293.1 GAF and ANTAR domain-containing protein [Streptomyces justiciae]
MPTGGGAGELLASAERRAAVARARSAHETSCAERHTALADKAPTETLRDVHARVAALHRATAACHLTAARLQDDYVARLTTWTHQRDTPQPLFMAGVAAACGTGSVALTLVGATPDQLALAASDEPARAALELEFLIGEGPARDAIRRARPVSASGAVMTARWPRYGPALAELGMAEVAAVPLSLSGACVGALAVFDPAPGVIGSAFLAEIAEALTRSMILSPDGEPGLYGGLDVRATVHQAAGMLAVQLDRPVEDALELIRAHALTEGASAQSVAARILRGELRLG